MAAHIATVAMVSARRLALMTVNSLSVAATRWRGCLPRLGLARGFGLQSASAPPVPGVVG
jgi:hypothetical protein